MNKMYTRKQTGTDGCFLNQISQELPHCELLDIKESPFERHERVLKEIWKSLEKTLLRFFETYQDDLFKTDSNLFQSSFKALLRLSQGSFEGRFQDSFKSLSRFFQDADSAQQRLECYLKEPWESLERERLRGVPRRALIDPPLSATSS